MADFNELAAEVERVRNSVATSIRLFREADALGSIAQHYAEEAENALAGAARALVLAEGRRG